MPRFIDLMGDRFGSLMVIWRAPSRRRNDGKTVRMWWCHCDCGTERAFRGSNLRSGASTSCGRCWQAGDVG